MPRMKDIKLNNVDLAIHYYKGNPDKHWANKWPRIQRNDTNDDKPSLFGRPQEYQGPRIRPGNWDWM